MTNYEAIMKNIKNNTEKFGIIGLGYVGLPLAVFFARNGGEILGFERSYKKAQLVKNAEIYVCDVTNEDIV